MKKKQNFTYFSLDRSGNLKDVLENSGKLTLLNPPRKSLEGDVPSEIIHKLYQKGLSLNGAKYFFNASLGNLDKRRPKGLTGAIIEHTFELIRKLYFPSAPSRFQSVFGWATLSDLKKFAQKYSSSAPHKDVYEYISKTEGFKVDMNWLRLGDDFSELYTYAFLYWSQKATADPLWEYLIPLPVKLKKHSAKILF